jgi:hypothetical protein
LVSVHKKNRERIKKGLLPLRDYRRFHVFHSFELILVLGIIGFYSKIIFLMFLGLLIHIFLDLIDYFYLRYKLGKEFDIGRHYFAVDFLYILLSNKK